MKKVLYPLIFLALLPLLHSCGGDRVQVAEFSPSGEVEPFTTFSVTFNKDLAPPESQGEWLETGFMKFEPEVSGKYKWLDARTLTFSPDQPLKPGQDYTARVTEEVLFGKSVKTDFEALTFHTPYFDAVSVDFFWTQIPRSDYKVTVQCNLQFNYAVDPQELGKFLEVTREGKPVKNFDIVTTKPSDLIAINFGEQQQTEKAQKFQITIKPGLKSIETAREMSDARSFDVELAPLTRLAVTHVTSGFDGQKGWIEVYTTQPVDEEVVGRYVSLDPTRKVKYLFNQHSFRMEAAFDPRSEVDVTIKKGLPGLYGGKLEDSYTQKVVMADLAPSLEFADENGQYLMRGGSEKVGLTAINLRRVDIKVYQVFENNVLYYLYNQGKKYYSDACCGASNYFTQQADYGREDYEDEYYDDYYYDDYYYYGDNSINDYGKLLKEDSVILGDQQNRVMDFSVDMGEHLDQRFKGIYVIEARDYNDYWRRKMKIVAVSDLGMIVKRSHNELMVFVNSIKDATPVEGVEISLISTNNQTLLTGTTDGSGMVRFQKTVAGIENFTPRLITARKGQDFNFVDFKDTELGLSRFDVGGKTEYSREYDTYLYADRNLFRPGESAHFATIVRTKSMETVPDLPVVFKVTNPRGKVLIESKATLDKAGSAEMEVALPQYAPTGGYTCEVLAGESLLATYSFSVEEFVPDKIRVEAEGNAKILDPGETLDMEVFSEYLFGAPCAECPYEVDVNLRHAPFYSKKYSNYNFYTHSVSNTDFDNDLTEGKLNADGKEKVSYTAPTQMEARGIIQAKAFVTVFDATGRTVSRTVPFEVHPNSYFIGVKSPGYYFGLGRDIRFSVAAVNSKDQPVRNLSVEVELVRHEWRSVLREDNNGRFYYQSERKEVPVKKSSMSLTGSAKSYVVNVDRSGQYEIRFRKKGDERYVSQTFYAYGSGGATATSFPVDREGRIEITTDKETYKPGEKARVLFTTPFSGKMLVTVEREGILDHRYIDVENNSAEMELAVTEEHLPNMYIGATLFRAHGPNPSTPFFVGHGYAAVKVDEPDNKIPVTIQAPKRIKPRRNQEIVVKAAAGENVHVTLAVVDEGILQIKNYKSPDPYAYMYARRKLSVSTYDLYEMLLEEVSGRGSSAAGGDDEAARRLNPVTAERFKLLSFWSGIRRTNANGEVRISVPIPHFNGSARIMAVAWKGKRFGSASESMIITDDVVLMPAAPRFLAPGDSIALPVSLMNTTDRSGDIAVSVRTEGPIKVSSDRMQKIRMGGKDNKNVRFGLKVAQAVGEGKIIIETSGLDNVKDEIEIAVRPVAPLVVTHSAGSIKGGASKNVSIPGDFIAGTQRASLTISHFPAVKFAHHFRYLVGYPHGCLEQTTSKVFPQIYFESLASAVAPDYYVNGNPVYFVKQGIRKIQGMQMSDGSLSYWPGGGRSNWWTTVYATHFLVEAKKAGYDVNEHGLNRLLSYLNREASKKETYQYRTWRNGAITSEVKARKEIPYTLYVLALADKPDISLMNYYRARPHLLSGDTRYLLAGAFGLENKWNAFKDLLPEAFIAEKPERESGRSFDSEVRANAMMLMVLLETDPSNKQVPSLVKYLSSAGTRIWSTQDRSWTFLALGKAAARTANTNMTVAASVGGKNLGTWKGDNLTINLDGQKGPVSLKANGTGEVYYFLGSEGVPADPRAAVPEVDENLRVRRIFLNRSGNVISDANFKQGDLVVCRISITTGLRGVENVAVSDLIPSGFEIDNPRLGSSTSMNWVKNTLYPDYMDIRDDRLVLFTDLAAGKSYEFHYMLRVVNAGKFRLAPIGAEAMYDPDYRSYNGAGWVNVEPR